MDFDPKGARYVALRWTPADQGLGKSFEVAEVSAFGDMPLSMLSTSELPDVYADNSMGLMSPPARYPAASAPTCQPVGFSAFTISPTVFETASTACVKSSSPSTAISSRRWPRLRFP